VKSSPPRGGGAAPIRSALLVGVPDRVSAANLKAANDASRRTVNVLFR